MSSLTADLRIGALIVGDFGMGKTALLREGLDRLGDDTVEINVRGAAEFRDVAYGALSYLLTELETGDLNSPALVLAVLTQKVDELALTGPPIVVADNADELDAFSAAMLAQLARNGTARLVVTCEDLRAVPAELSDLWCNGHLDRFDLAPLSVADAGTMLTAALGSETSPSALQRLWEASGGNPLYLQAVTAEQLESGNLFDSCGIWCLANHEIHPSRSSLEIAHSRLTRLPSVQREVVELLSMTGELPLEDLSHVVAPATIIALEDTRWIKVEQGTPPVVRIADRFIEKVTRSSLPAGLRRHYSTVLTPVQLSQAVPATGSTPADARTTHSLAAVRSAQNQQGQSIRQLLKTCQLSATYAQTGRALDGVELAEIALADLSAAHSPVPVNQRAHTSLFTSSLFAGQWPEYHKRLASLKDSNWSHSASDASIAELGRGLLYAHGGQPALALKFLTPAIKQLDAWDMTGPAGLGSAAESYSYTLLEDSGRAREAFENAQHSRSKNLPRSIERHLLYFSALSTAHLTSKNRAIEQLMAQSDEAVRAGALSQEILLLSTIVRFGRTSLAERLARQAAKAQGSFAELCRLYGSGVSAGASEPLLEAAALAASFGNDLFSADAARAALELAQPNQEQVRAAKRILSAHSRHATEAQEPGHAARLTRRELETARLAATGATNRDIADAFSVSIRTVEGHIHRSLSKLSLASRNDLQISLESSRGAAA